jgi:hypothetical protein
MQELTPEPQTITQLFSKEPRSLSQNELLRMIEYYRSIRKDFSEAPVPRAKKKPLASAPADLSLDDLAL